MAQLAVLTIGLLHDAWESARSAGFVERTGPIFAAAADSQGYVAHAFDEAAQRAWGDHALPAAFQPAEYEGRLPDTLSLWQDLEAIYAFAYHGRHGEALGHRREWFAGGLGPSHVAWWVPDGHTPTWQEACARYDQLQQHGPSPDAFELLQPFAADGQPTRVDREAVKARAALNPPAPAAVPTPEAVVAGYIAAWSEPDSAARQRLLDRVWAEHGAYADPTVELTGRAALNAHIGGFLHSQPGARFTLTAPPDFHHTHTRFYWTLHFAHGAAVPGMDYGEFGPDGKLVKIVGFF